MKKIMFNDRYGLAAAVLSGRKTVTRRIVSGKVWDKWADYDDWCNSIGTDNIPTTREYYTCEAFFADHPPYKLGEIVAVAQSYRILGYDSDALDRSPKDYRHIRGSLGQSKGWNNKMFVRAEACKHQIRITGIRAERLQDITDRDCLKEGISFIPDIDKYYFERIDKEEGFYFDTPREAFASLIDKISGPGTWKRNPFVWRIKFKLVK